MAQVPMISKNEVLKRTGTSYGQFYRWKRKGLIPEAWFNRRSTYTGQETFLPQEKILERIRRINDLKDGHSFDEIDVELDGRSTAQEIGGSKITVRRKRGDLEVQSIEGDDIYLEATKAQTIRGKRVKLGEGCRVDTVEYTESLDVSPEATVGSQVRTGEDDQPSV